MNSRILLLPTVIALSLAARTGEAFFEAHGTVANTQSTSGVYTAVQVGDAVRLQFKVLTPGMVITAGELEQFTVDPTSVIFDVGALSTADGTGTPSMIMQNGNFGGPDGVRLFSAPLMGNSVITYDFSAGSPNMFTSTDPLQNLGLWTPVLASYDCRISGGGTFIEWTPTTLRITNSTTGNTFCYGDGSGAACPCANFSPVGEDVGCLNSLGLGGRLLATGVASLSNDLVVLAGSNMPSSSALYFQGTTMLNGGLGTPFGDGLRCPSGTIVRIGTKSNTAGASSYPVGGDMPVSVRGLVTAPGSRSYQCWYRNAASFCTASTFNLTNLLEITWGA